MPTLLKVLGYTAGLQSYTWPADYPPVNARIWLYAGGGGGAGVDSDGAAVGRRGGSGSGGALSYNVISLDPGDSIGVAVAQGGRGGRSVSGGAAAGGPGGRGLNHTVLTSLGLHNTNPTRYPRVSLDGRWTSFLNTNGIWVNPDANPWEDVFTVNIPYTGFYTFEWSVDDTIIWRVDGQDINTESGGFRNIFATSVQINKGTHTIGWRAFNARGPRGFAFRIYMSFAGGDGSASGTAPSNRAGGGGGGGGATVLLKNDEIIGVAAGGAGGGGPDDGEIGDDADAPNPAAGQSGIRDYAGGDGQNTATEGGGSGGGGGGLRGGNGGPASVGTGSGKAGMYGQITSSGGFGGTALGIPAGKNSNFPTISNKYYSLYRARGGAGATRAFNTGQNGDTGIAWIEFDVPAPYIRLDTGWQEVQRTWIRTNDGWRVPDTWVWTGTRWQVFLDLQSYLFFDFQINSVSNENTRPFGRIDVQPSNIGPF